MNMPLMNRELNLPLQKREELRQTSQGIISRNCQIAPEILIAMRQGNQDAYSKVYAHYQKPLCEFLGALTRSREDAEDITHDVFINVWENREKLDPDQGIRRYLYAVAKHLAMRYFRQKKNDGHYRQYNGMKPSKDIATDEILFAKEADALIDKVITRMPRIRGQIFEMYYKEDLSYDQIADKLGMNKATVANHLSHARKDIRKVL